MTDASPSRRAEAVTPSDTVDLDTPCRALYVGGTGDVSIQNAGGEVTFSSAQAGSILPVYASRVNSTNTTATNIVALY